MKYKALMLDLDGTVVPLSQTRFPRPPSKQVIQALNQAKKKVFVSLVTARPIFKAKPILKRLQLNAPSILLNGVHIINSQTFKTIWQKPLSQKIIKSLYQLGRKHNLNMHSCDFINDFSVRSLKQVTSQNIAEIFFTDLTEKELLIVEKDLSQLKDIATHRMISHRKGYWVLAITDIRATKRHAIFYVAKLLRIKPQQIIGVGDGPNDYPLLMASGLKIAMGNAVPELKAIADFVAPSVDEDGLVTVIEKFFL
jgi:HAD superfamily hydrolase (TIGR01484 family)